MERGSKVYKKWNNSKKWKGLGVVIGPYGKIISIGHGSTYVTVSVNWIIKAGTKFKNPSDGK